MDDLREVIAPKMNPLARLIRRAALWVVFKGIPVEHPAAKVYTEERTDSCYIEDQVTIRRAMECYFWIRQIAD
ncbi:hypothetical protein [Qipengyuania flava]|uniref:hypothetical protein n=1 Tax=Qipengyuania flava TaxID=192812 RepID=UPI00273DE97A|nr:hypothetical protein [Qipengyuania flava]